MRKYLFLFLMILLGVGVVKAQLTTPTLILTSNPVGACPNGRLAVNISAATSWICNSGWKALGTGSGTISTINIGTTGTAPNWVAGTSTLHIPMASTATVTAGLLSKTDYDSFTAKLSSVRLDQVLDPTADWTPTIGAYNVTITGTGLWDFGAMPANSTTGYRIGGLAPLGNVLRGDDTNFVSARLAYSDLNGTPAAVPGQDGVISGCTVAWAGGLVFTVSSCTYTIAGIQYTSPQANVTLDAAETGGGAEDRIDVIAVNTSSVATFIKGTPGTPPAKPIADFTTQLELTFAYLAVDAVTPSDVLQTDLYLEGAGTPTEWTYADSGATLDGVSTNNPYAGTKDIEATSAVATNYVTLTKPAGTVNLAGYNNLILYIRSKAAWPNAKSLVLRWLNGSTQVGNTITLKTGNFNFSSSITATYQQVVIPVASFATGASLVDVLKIQVVGGGAAIGFYLDNIGLQGGLSAPTLPANLMIYRGAYVATTNYAKNDVVTSGGSTWIALQAVVAVTPVAGAYWSALGAAGGATTTTHVYPLQDCVADTVTNPGNSFWTVAQLTNFKNMGHWEFTKNTAAGVDCQAYIPHTVAATPAAKIRLVLAANDATAGHTDAFNMCDVQVSTTIDAAACTAAGAQNFTTTATAYAPVVLDFTVSAAVTANSLLYVTISQAASNSVVNNVFGKFYLVIDETE